MSDQAEAVVGLAPAKVSELAAAGDAELIDVRMDYEFEAGHVQGSRNIELNELTGQAESLPRDRTIVFLCRSGNRSGMAAEAFRQAGFDAHNMEGGLLAWTEQGLPIDPADGEVAERRPV